jgi:hypothetical protein
MSGAAPAHELNFCLALRWGRRVNPEWLEEHAIQLEDTLIERGRDLACGYSVTANFQEHGFEVDYTVEAASLSEAYDRMSQIVRIIEDVIGFSVQSDEEVEATASTTVAAVPA